MPQTINPASQETVLDRVYPKNEIFIRNAKFVSSEAVVEVTCLVPLGRHYTATPIPYVTAENYVRCLSQACYLLTEHVLKEGLLPVEASLEAFLEAAASYELYYRNLAMTFHERAKRGKKFVLKLSIKNVREIKRLSKDYILFSFANERTVISGEMSFVYVNTTVEG